MRMVLVMLLLAGCATYRVTEFAGATDKDRTECEFEAEKHRTFNYAREHDRSFPRLYDACMRARGYK